MVDPSCNWTHPMKQPWLYQKEAWPFMHGAPGWVALTQPSPSALGLHPSVLASQLTSCASTALREVGNVMHPWAATVARQAVAAVRRASIAFVVISGGQMKEGRAL